jgi:hypothetical protein
MIRQPTGTRALAVDIRRLDTDELLGVALLVPSGRCAAFLAEGASAPTSPTMSPEVWSEIDAWAADADARLPARPAPVSRSIAAALVGGHTSAVGGQRFASILVPTTSQDDLPVLLDSALPGLSRARRSAA